MKSCAFIVALSEVSGFVHIRSFAKSVNTVKYIMFLKDIRKKFKSKNIAIYQDGATFHTANKVKQYASKNDIELL